MIAALKEPRYKLQEDRGHRIRNLRGVAGLETGGSSSCRAEGTCSTDNEP